MVHAYGRPKIVEESAQLQEMLTKLVATFEGPMDRPWRTDWADERNEIRRKAIVGFEMEITRVWKENSN